jgi:hypothetical protein
LHAAFREARLRDYNLGSADRNAYANDLAEDECVMDLEQMRRWCPTAAYSLVSALRLQKVVALCEAGTATDADKACESVWVCSAASPHESKDYAFLLAAAEQNDDWCANHCSSAKQRFAARARVVLCAHHHHHHHVALVLAAEWVDRHRWGARGKLG